MSNINSFAGFFNLPAQIVASSTVETVYLVPAAGAYPSLPSPTQAAAKGLYVGSPNDLTVGSQAFDGKPFKVRAAGVVNTSGGAENVTVKLYQAPASIIALATQATVGNDNLLATTGAVSVNGKASFLLEAECMWDSGSLKLQSTYWTMLNGTRVAPTAATAITTLSIADLNFVISVTFATGAATDSITPVEFALDRA